MIILVLILALVVLWAIVLGPALLEKRKGSPSNSIVAFNNRLSVLAATQQPEGPAQYGAAPQSTEPGQFVRAPAVSTQRPSFPPPGSTITIVTEDGRPIANPPQPKTSFEGPVAALSRSPRLPNHLAGGTLPRQPAVRVSTGSERSQQQRRKLILQVLLGLAGGTFVLGLLPGARAILLISLVFIGLLGAYVYLLIQWKQNRVEQGRKVRHLRSTEALAPAGVLIEGESDDDQLRLVSGESRP